MATATPGVPTSAATLTCLCGAVSLPGSYLSESHFPVTSELCHCTDCRWSSGGLLPAFPQIKQAPPKEVLAKLTAYHRSELCTQYFCPTCGTNCFLDHTRHENDWFCLNGVIDLPISSSSTSSTPRPDNILSITSHAYIEGTLDGGLVPLFLGADDNTPNPLPILYPNRHGDEFPTYSREEVVDMAKASLQSKPTASPPAADKLTAKCHCGGVFLSIARADYVNNAHNVHARMIPNPREHKDKYIAWFCACRSCRLATGLAPQGWVYVPPAAVTDGVTDERVVFGLAALESGANNSEGLRGLKHYRSSQDTLRSFCGGCGATVFYTYIGEGGHGVVDVSAGILRAPSGSMAREFVYWRPDGWMSHEEEAVDADIAKVMKKGWDGVGLGQ